MRPRVKVLGILGTIAFAFSLVAAASASAAIFQVNETGTLKGHALNAQVFTFSGGTAKCTTATTSGSVTGYSAEELKVSVAYSGCTAFGQAASVSTAEYDLHANGTVDVLNTITISITGCTVKVGPQSGLKSVSYENSTKLIEKGSVSSIVYTSSGGACGSSGSSGTFSGNSELELNEGAGFVGVIFEGGALSKKVLLNGKEGPCDITKVGDVCTIEFTVNGVGPGWVVEKNEFTGTDAATRYTAAVGCPVTTKLEETKKAGEVRKCTDTYTNKVFVAGGKNFSCVIWDPPGPGVKAIPFCTNLLM